MFRVNFSVSILTAVMALGLQFYPQLGYANDDANYGDWQAEECGGGHAGRGCRSRNDRNQSVIESEIGQQCANAGGSLYRGAGGDIYCMGEGVETIVSDEEGNVKDSSGWYEESMKNLYESQRDSALAPDAIVNFDGGGSNTNTSGGNTITQQPQVDTNPPPPAPMETVQQEDGPDPWENERSHATPCGAGEVNHHGRCLSRAQQSQAEQCGRVQGNFTFLDDGTMNCTNSEGDLINPTTGQVVDTNRIESGFPEDPDRSSIQAEEQQLSGAALQQKIADEINSKEIYKQCNDQKVETLTCCRTSPGSCLAKALGATSDTSQKVGGVVGGIAQGVAGYLMMGGGQRGVGDMCGTMKRLSQTSAGINGAMAAYCGKSIGACEDVCGSASEQLEQEKNTFVTNNCSGYTTTSNAYANCRALVLDMVNAKIRAVDRQSRDCKIQQHQVARMTSQAFEGVMASKMAKECESIASTNAEIDNGTGDLTGIDCGDPANASLPSCQSCSGPNAAQNPACPQYVAGGDPNQNGLRGRDELGDFNVGDGDLDDALLQDPNNADIEAQGNQVAKASGSGGGGGLGGGGGGFAGGGGGGKGRAGKKGYNANILKGLGKGGGYSSRVGRVSGGGGGYSYNRGGKGRKNAGSKFDLKKYLPGQEKGKRGRVAGLSAINRGIASPTSNIFTNISKRFQFVCKTNRLHCNTGRKRAKKRGL